MVAEEKQPDTGRQTCFQQYLIAPKMLHCSWNATCAFVIPFLSILYRLHGMDSVKIGILVSIPPFISFVSASLWSMLADRTGHHRRVLIITVIGTLLSIISIIFAFGRFAVLAVSAFAYAILQGPTWPLLDTFVLSTLGNDRQLYGRQRLWGSIGWGITGPIAGVMMNSAPTWTVFVPYAVLGVVFVCLVRVLTPESFRAGAAGPPKKAPFLPSMRKLLSNWALLSFLVNAFIFGACSGMIFNYRFLFLVEYLNASNVILGLSPTFTILTEIIWFWFQKPLSNKLGVLGMVITSHVGAIVRLVLYSFLANPWLILPIELCHGLMFGAIWGAGVTYSAECAPPGLEATAQGLFFGVYAGMGFGTGGLVGGYLYKEFGPFIMWRIAGAAVAVNLLIFIVSYYCLRRQRQHQQSAVTPAAGESEVHPVGYDNLEGGTGMEMHSMEETKEEVQEIE